MPGSRFWRTQRLRLVQELSQRISDNAPPDRRTGTKVGAGQVNVDNQTYELRDGGDVAVGASVELENIGRRSAAIYRPVRGTVSVSGGGGGTGATGTLGDHTHTDTDGDGGTFPITNHSDVSATGPSNNDVLVYNSSTGEWENSTDVAVLSRANTFTAAQTFPNSGVHILDTGGDHDLILASGENLTADHTLTMVLSDGDRTVTLSGNPTLNDWFDQSVKQAASPTFAAVTLGNTGLKVQDTDASHTLTLKPGSNLAANRTLTLTTGDADRELILSGNLTVPETGTAALLGVANIFTANQRFDERILISASQSAYNSTSQAALYMTDGGGGSYPFNEGSNFVIQGRSTTRDVVIATGSTPAVAAVFDRNGNTALGHTNPQGLLHGYDSISGFLHWEFDGLDGTARDVIPNGTNDAVYGAMWMSIVRSSSGIVKTSSGQEVGGTAMSTIPGISREIFNDGGTDIVELSHNADGSIEVQRTAGTDTYKVAIWILFL